MCQAPQGGDPQRVSTPTTSCLAPSPEPDADSSGGHCPAGPGSSRCHVWSHAAAGLLALGNTAGHSVGALRSLWGALLGTAWGSGASVRLSPVYFLPSRWSALLASGLHSSSHGFSWWTSYPVPSSHPQVGNTPRLLQDLVCRLVQAGGQEHSLWGPARVSVSVRIDRWGFPHTGGCKLAQHSSQVWRLPTRSFSAATVTRQSPWLHSEGLGAGLPEGGRWLPTDGSPQPGQSSRSLSLTFLGTSPPQTWLSPFQLGGAF